MCWVNETRINFFSQFHIVPFLCESTTKGTSPTKHIFNIQKKILAYNRVYAAVGESVSNRV
jgi:hypothetical protein